MYYIDNNFPLVLVTLLSVGLMLLLLNNRRQVKTLKQLKLSLTQQNNTNEHLNRITTELRRSTKLLSVLVDPQKYETEDFGQEQVSKLYIGNIDYSIQEEELEDLFTKYGRVANINIPVDRYSGKPRGFAFVTFEDIDDALNAIELNGYELKGRAIQVNFAKEREGQRSKNIV